MSQSKIKASRRLINKNQDLIIRKFRLKISEQSFIKCLAIAVFILFNIGVKGIRKSVEQKEGKTWK